MEGCMLGSGISEINIIQAGFRFVILKPINKAHRLKYKQFYIGFALFKKATMAKKNKLKNKWDDE